MSAPRRCSEPGCNGAVSSLWRYCYDCAHRRASDLMSGRRDMDVLPEERPRRHRRKNGQQQLESDV